MTRLPSHARLALLVVLAACVSPTGLVSDGTIEVLPRRADVQLRNLTDRAAYYFIAGYSPGAREAVLFWWWAVPTGSGALAADSIRTLTVRL